MGLKLTREHSGRHLSEELQNGPGLQKINLETILQFTEFIVDLGPDATWLNFLKSLCDCGGTAIPVKQQQILQIMYYQGKYATEEEKKRFGKSIV